MGTLNKLVTIGGTVVIVLLLAIIFLLNKPIIQGNLGSVSVGSSYKSTTTLGALVTPITTGVGNLGSVITTKTGTGDLTIYDATTTVATQRTITATTSLKVLAYFPASPTVGTYVFDSQFYYGLMAVWGTGTVSSTTITYRFD